MLGKSTRNPRKCKKTTTVKPVEGVYTDVVWPMKVASIKNSKYTITLFDEYSGYSMVLFLNRKRQASDALKEMVMEIENLFNSKIENLHLIRRNSVKWIRSDGGGEYIGGNLHEWLKGRGIIHEVTTAFSPESNGRAERLNRTLMYIARTMMVAPNKQEYAVLWAEAVNTANHIQNRLVTRSTK